MSYTPREEILDFEIGAFGDRIKKGIRKVGAVVNKVTDATIVRPTAAIGGAIGGKRGRKIGEKLGKVLATTSTIGMGGAAAGAMTPIAKPIIRAAATGMAIKKAKKRLFGKNRKASKIHAGRKGGTPIHKVIHSKHQNCPSNTELAAQVASMLVSKLGGPLSEANKALKLAELQREATYEHHKLMGDAEFRKQVLTGIAKMASKGNASCERTIRVLVGR